MNEDFMAQYDGILTRLFEDARSDPGRMTKLAELVDDLPAARFGIALQALGAADVGAWSDSEKRQVYSTLRDVAARHLRFPDAAWAMPMENAQAILAVADRFAPHDPVQRLSWLFAAHVELPEVEGSDWRATEEAVAVARASAVAQLWGQGGYEEIARLSRVAEAPWTIGLALADGQVVDDLLQFVNSLLDDDFAHHYGLARALLLRTADRLGNESLISLLADPRAAAWAPEWRALVYGCMEFDAVTWAAVAAEGEAVDSHYWRSVSLMGRGALDQATITTVVSNLVRVGNWSAAIDFLQLYGERAEREQILVVLETASSSEVGSSIPWERLGTDVIRLIELLQQSPGTDQDRVASLEWRLMPFIRGHHEPKALEGKLSRDPDFFIEVLTLAFKARDEEHDPNPSANAKAVASRAYQLLWAWRTPPGLTAEGTMDASTLQQWVARARSQAAAVGRAEIADLRLGEVMAHVPVGQDGIWPAEPLRDLIESLQSEEFDRGIIIGVANSRGVTSRALGAGGEQERELESKYAASVAAVRDHWPRAAAVLNRIAEGYRRDAQRMDVEAALERREAQSES